MALRKIVSPKTGKPSWQIDYLDPGNNRIRVTFKTRKEANAELAKRISLKAENRYLDAKKEYKTTLGEFLDQYEKDYKDQPSFITAKRFFVKNIRTYFKESTLLSSITYADLRAYQNHLKQKTTKHGRKRKPATINRTLACLRHIMSDAVVLDKIDKSPFDIKKGKSLFIEENNARLRFLSKEEIPLLLKECKPYLKNIVECAINSGMRKTEILSLKWNQIRNGLIFLTKTKSKKARQIPINETLQDLFNQIKSEQNPKGNVVSLNGKPKQKRSSFVFTFSGQPVKDVKRCFNDAKEEAGILDFRFHDLRHTFASHFIMEGGSLKSLKEILGHSKFEMTMRYAHLSQEYKRKEINLLNSLTGKPRKKKFKREYKKNK